MILKNARVLGANFEFASKTVYINNGIISQELCGGEEIDCTGLTAVPGLIDIHTHGCMNYETIDDDPEGIYTMSKYMSDNGVTTFIPTLNTSANETMHKCIGYIKDAAQKINGTAAIGGVYLEGPYLSYKYKGAQNEKFLHDCDLAEFEGLYEKYGDFLRVIAVAPERDGSMEFISAVKNKITVAIGHTDADYECASEAIKCGAKYMTHTFNAMRPLKHREPNAIGAAIDSDIFCECICDGFHVHPAVVRILYRALTSERMVLISDSIRPAGCPDGEYRSGGLDITVKNKTARLKDGTIAGSTAALMDCVKKAVEFGIPQNEAFKMATINPARAVGLDSVIGSIDFGKDADILLIDDNCNIVKKIIKGKLIK